MHKVETTLLVETLSRVGKYNRLFKYSSTFFLDQGALNIYPLNWKRLRLSVSLVKIEGNVKPPVQPLIPSALGVWNIRPSSSTPLTTSDSLQTRWQQDLCISIMHMRHTHTSPVSGASVGVVDCGGTLLLLPLLPVLLPSQNAHFSWVHSRSSDSSCSFAGEIVCSSDTSDGCSAIFHISMIRCQCFGSSFLSAKTPFRFARVYVTPVCATKISALLKSVGYLFEPTWTTGIRSISESSPTIYPCFLFGSSFHWTTSTLALSSEETGGTRMMDVPPLDLVARGLDKFAFCFRNASMLQRKAVLHTSRASSNCVGPWTLDSHKALYIVQWYTTVNTVHISLPHI